MANLYLDSVTGNNADNGTTWALAKATIAGIAAIDAAGDVIYVGDSHAETTAGTVNVPLAGTRVSPTRVLCVDDSTGEPPPAGSLRTTATISVTGVSALTFSGANLYFYGITFQAGSAANVANLNLATTALGRAVYDSCVFSLTTTNTSSRINVTGGDTTQTEWRNCQIKFGNNGCTVSFTSNGSYFRWIGGSVVSGSSSPNTSTNAIFGSAGTGGTWLVENVDFSVFAAGVHIDNGGGGNTNAFTIRNCKLPASWSGNLVRTAITSARRVAMYNCSAGSENYKLWIEQLEGSIRDETTIVRTGGATDGVTHFSFKMTSSTDIAYPAGALFSDEWLVRVNNTGSPITLTVHIIHDSATNLKDDEVWVEASYLGSSSQPQGTLITDAKADVLDTAADQDASTETWTTTGLSNPNKQKLNVTFTPQMQGFVQFRVVLAKPSYTIYYCPKGELS